MTRLVKIDSSCKMIKMCFSFLFIFILINFQVEAKNSCNDECLTKTYCLSSDGSGVCSKNNLATAQFKVEPIFGEFDYLQITLKGYNVAVDEEKTIKVSFDRPGRSSNIFTCYKSSLGSTYARFDRDTYSKTFGSSHYVDGVLYCTWTFNIFDSITPPDMLRDSSQSIALYSDSRKVTVANDTSQLPIYHAQYLKCCNKVHGNDAFRLTFDQTDKEIRYQLYYFKLDGSDLTVTLLRKDGTQLQFECYLYSNALKVRISNGSQHFSVDDQLMQRNIIFYEICSWATPFVVGNSMLSIDASTSVFDLRVEDDVGTVYTEKGVTLKNSSHFAKSSFVLVAFAVLCQIL
uniref:CUB domain-containing protein n=1 Tax=Tetranychus urticae TaxID=32264 RepID=T1JT28_TETUR